LFVSLPSFNSGGNVSVLPSFASATEQNNECLAIAPVINAIARSKIHSHFKDALSQCFGRAKITRFEPAKISLNSQCGYIVQSFKPIPEWRTVIFRVFPNLKRTIHNGIIYVTRVNPSIHVFAAYCARLPDSLGFHSSAAMGGRMQIGH